MKTTRRTAVILGLWSLCTVVYAGMYFGRSTMLDAGITAAVTHLQPIGNGPLFIQHPPAPGPVQRMFGSAWETWVFTPAAEIESLITGREVRAVDSRMLFRC